jgi:hypothetical protein
MTCTWNQSLGGEGRSAMGRNSGGEEAVGRQIDGEAWLSDDTHKVKVS